LHDLLELLSLAFLNEAVDDFLSVVVKEGYAILASVDGREILLESIVDAV
jgi:hypothetical protein